MRRKATKNEIQEKTLSRSRKLRAEDGFENVQRETDTKQSAGHNRQPVRRGHNQCGTETDMKKKVDGTEDLK